MSAATGITAATIRAGAGVRWRLLSRPSHLGSSPSRESPKFIRLKFCSCDCVTAMTDERTARENDARPWFRPDDARAVGDDIARIGNENLSWRDGLDCHREDGEPDDAEHHGDDSGAARVPPGVGTLPPRGRDRRLPAAVHEYPDHHAIHQSVEARRGSTGATRKDAGVSCLDGRCTLRQRVRQRKPR